jgi:hypothetical protein
VSKHITPDVLRLVAEGLTEADARPMYGKVEYVTEEWWQIFSSTRVACLLHHSPEDVGFDPHASAIQAPVVAQVCGEIARIVASNVAYAEDSDMSAMDVLDALEDLVGELAQVRAEPHSRGTLIFFTGTKADA